MYDMFQMLDNGAMRSKATIYDFERGLLYHSGRFVKTLEPGRYNYWWSRNYGIVKVDLRSNSLVVGSQEIPTADGVQVRASFATFFAIEDAKKYFDSAQNAQSSIYVELQMLLREYVAGKPLDDLLGGSPALDADTAAKCQAIFERYGCRMESAGIRDLSTSGELKRAYSEVLKAKKLGEAALEKARAETAAMRSLANAARMMAEQPALLQLRAIQALGESAGSTLVLGAESTIVKKPTA